MDIIFFLKGLAVGFSIAAPVGPIGVLCIRRSLTEGRVSGLITGLGAATADALYACIGGFALTSISNFLTSQQVWLRIIGGAFLLFLGFKYFLSKPVKQVATTKKPTLTKTYTSAFFLTLTNPITILSFAAIFAGLGLGSESREYTAASVLILGVFVGSTLWWLALSTSASLFRTRLNQRGLQWVNRVSGTIIMGFGLAAIVSIL